MYPTYSAGAGARASRALLVFVFLGFSEMTLLQISYMLKKGMDTQNNLNLNTLFLGIGRVSEL